MSTTSEDQPAKVQLNVYDLSQGLASQLSLPILGIHLKAIYHTSITVFNTEYFFNSQGIMRVRPLTSHFGTPFEIRDMGESYIPQEIFEEFLGGLVKQFGAGCYDLFGNNCNDFSKLCLEFLNGSELDDEIGGMSKRVLETEKGEMIRTWMMGMIQ